jgi:hypothetical protein
MADSCQKMGDKAMADQYLLETKPMRSESMPRQAELHLHAWEFPCIRMGYGGYGCKQDNHPK